MTDIRIVKLISGEDLLTQVDIDEGLETLTLIKPMLLVPQPNGLQMVPWLMLAKKETVHVKEYNVITMYEPRDELVNGYRQQTGSLVVAPAGVLNKEGKLIL
jgi:hypothetical protein